MMSSSNTKPAATAITKKTVFSAQEALFTKQIDFLNQVVLNTLVYLLPLLFDLSYLACVYIDVLFEPNQIGQRRVVSTESAQY